MKLTQLNILLDSGVPIVCVTASIRERMTVLKQIYIECGIEKNLALYLWNAGWGVFKQVKCDEECISFSCVDLSSLHTSNENIFAAFDCFLNSDEDGIFILENLPSLARSTLSHASVSVDTKIVSQVINIYYELENSLKSKYLILLVTDDVQLPQSLSSLIPTLSTTLPSTQEIADLINKFIPEFIGHTSTNIDISSLVNAASGLTAVETRLGLAIATRSCSELNSNTLVQKLLAYKINLFRDFNLNFVPKPSVPDFGGWIY